MRRNPQAGYTLLEVMVASLIMAITIVALLGNLSTSMHNASRLQARDRAAQLAREKMDELLVLPTLPKRVVLEGRFDPATVGNQEMGWRARIMPYEVEQGSGPGSSMLERVELEILWRESGQPRNFLLEAYRRNVATPDDLASGPAGALPGGLR